MAESIRGNHLSCGVAAFVLCFDSETKKHLQSKAKRAKTTNLAKKCKEDI